MREQKEELQTLSQERVFNEFKKALETNKPSIFFIYHELNLVKQQENALSLNLFVWSTQHF